MARLVQQSTARTAFRARGELDHGIEHDGVRKWPTSQLRARAQEEVFCQSLPLHDPIAAQKLLCEALARLVSNREPAARQLDAVLVFDRHAHQLSRRLLVQYCDGDAQLRTLDRRYFIAAMRLSRSFAQAYERFLGPIEQFDRPVRAGGRRHDPDPAVPALGGGAPAAVLSLQEAQLRAMAAIPRGVSVGARARTGHGLPAACHRRGQVRVRADAGAAVHSGASPGGDEHRPVFAARALAGARLDRALAQPADA